MKARSIPAWGVNLTVTAASTTAPASYVATGGFKHSNTVENFFSIFKRGVIGTYHHMSEAHLARYCREFDFRYNTRKLTDSERTI